MASQTVRICIAAILAVVINVAIAWAASFQAFVGRPCQISWVRRDPAAAEGNGWLRMDVCYAPAGRRVSAQAVPFSWYSTFEDRGYFLPKDLVPPLMSKLVLPWVYGERAFPPDNEADQLQVFAFGFPFLSLYSTSDQVKKIHVGTIPTRLHTPNLLEPNGLPILINLPAFLLNTLFWFGLIYLPPSAWIWIRQRRRRKLNLCLACGYALAGVPANAPCPECGKLPGVSGLPKADPA
jgi:hypothetical protein